MRFFLRPVFAVVLAFAVTAAAARLREFTFIVVDSVIST